jgi:HSP20 family molecular chaperone IbpA
MEADYVGNLEQVNGDVKERDNIYVVELELTEFDKDDIRVYFNDGYLVITAQNKLFL